MEISKIRRYSELISSDDLESSYDHPSYLGSRIVARISDLGSRMISDLGADLERARMISDDLV